MPLLNAQFDHIVVFVADLNRASADFTALGFQITPGGSHGITENALVIFSNQTYIELLALRPSWYRPLIKLAIKLNFVQRQAQKKTTIYSRLIGWICGDTGPVDWCARVNDLDASLTLWDNQDIEVLHSEAFSRERTDGEVAQWKLGGSRQADLPFLLQDTTPIDTRIPMLGTAKHANGAQALIAVKIAISDIAAIGNTLGKALSADTGQNGKADRQFRLGNVAVSLADMQTTDSKISMSLAYSGEQIQHLDISKTQGMKITLIPTP